MTLTLGPVTLTLVPVPCQLSFGWLWLCRHYAALQSALLKDRMFIICVACLQLVISNFWLFNLLAGPREISPVAGRKLIPTIQPI